MGDDGKKGGKLRKLFLFAVIAGLVTSVMRVLKRRRGASFEESEWQELPPPSS